MLSFLGAAGTVTGSRFLVEHAGHRVLVDCGLFQGLRELRRRNWQRFPVDPASIDAIVLTHAHVDHCGYLPALVRDGFQGPVYCSSYTADLARIVLPDSGRLNEEEAAFANRSGYSKHHPALPLFSEEDAIESLARLRPVAFGVDKNVVPGMSMRLRWAGHILGSSTVSLDIGTSGDGGGPTTILFSGDLGRPVHPVLRPPAPRPPADVIVCESTYGDREHVEGDAGEQLADVVRRTARRGGTVVLPAFAVDRTEVVLHLLARLRAAGEIPRLPVFVDSPMAAAALALYDRAVKRGAPEVRPELHGGDPFGLADVEVVTTVEESKELNARRGPMVIISASGMVTGGRVLHHLARRLSDDRNAVVLTGFQAAGTRGRSLVDGAREVKMLGRYWPVRAEVTHLDALSVHADRSELLDWLGSHDDGDVRAAPPDHVFVVHGEPSSSASFADAVTERYGWPAVVAGDAERVRVDRPYTDDHSPSNA